MSGPHTVHHWISSNGLTLKNRTSTKIELVWEFPLEESQPLEALQGSHIEGHQPAQEDPCVMIEMKKVASMEDWVMIYRGRDNCFQVNFLRPDTTYCFRMKRELDSSWGSVVFYTTEVVLPTSKDFFKAVSSNAVDLVIRMLGSCRRPYIQRLLNGHDTYGNTSLMIASSKGSLKLVQLLISHGSFINAQSLGSKKTALMLVGYAGSLQCVKFLCENGADWKLKDINGSTALHYIIHGGHLKCLQYALSQIRETGLIQERDCNGFDAVMKATVIGNYPKIVRELINAGADPDTPDPRNTKTPLFVACMFSKLAIIKVLLQSGADPTFRNCYGRTPLMVANGKHYSEIRELLQSAIRTKEDDRGSPVTLITPGEHFLKA